MARYYINYTTGNFLIDYNNTPYILTNGYTEVTKEVYEQYEQEEIERMEQEEQEEEYTFHVIGE